MAKPEPIAPPPGVLVTLRCSVREPWRCSNVQSFGGSSLAAVIEKIERTTWESWGGWHRCPLCARQDPTGKWLR